MAKPLLMFGCKSLGDLLQADAGYTDDGASYSLFVKTDRVAPAGVGGESAFHNLYIPIEHDVAVTLRVTAIVDGVALTAQDFALSAPSARKVTLLEVPTTVRFPVTIANFGSLAQFAARGTWLQVQLETVGAVTGYVAAGGVDLEHETLRETSQPGVNK